MSSDVKIPEEVRDAAFTLLSDVQMKDVDFTRWDAIASLERIAHALLAAEQRGLEKAADHLGQMAKETPLGHENIQRGRSTYNWLRYCEAAIRSLGENT